MPDESMYCGFLHLDLHPGNIFMENADWKNNVYGTVKFIDLQNAIGIRTDGSTSMEIRNQALGVTRGFCAPELMRKDFEQISIQTDLYSAAAIFLYMLTGTFQSNDASLSSYQFYNTNEITKILQNMNMVPAARIQLRYFLEKGLSKHSMNRFEDADQMLECLEQAWKFQELYDSGDYYTLYQLVFQAKLTGKHFQECSQNVSKDGFIHSVKELDNALHKDRINNSECRYIFQRLEALYLEHTELADAETLATLYSSGLAIYNHFADKKKCVEISDKLLKLKNKIHVIEWASIINRIAVPYADIFHMEKAMQILEDNIKNLEQIKDAYSFIASKEKTEPGTAKLTDLGRSYSAYATCMAYEGCEDPMKYFEKALQEFYVGKGNDSITISHILHFAVTKDYPFFDQWYRKLTGGKGLEEQDEIQIFLNTEDSKKNEFGLWIYLKAVYLFGMQEQIGYLKERILELLEYKGFYTGNPFPSAMSIKYCGLLLYKLDQQSCQRYADNAFRKAVRKLENRERKEYGELTLFKIMAYHIQSEAFLASGNELAAEKLYKEFMKKLDNSVFYRLKGWMEEYNKNKEIPEIRLKGEYF